MRGVSPEVLRVSLRRAVEASSLRTVAEQVGMTHRGLQLFISGETQPRVQTLQKLRVWYLSLGVQAGDSSDDHIQVAVDVLLDRLPDEARPQVLANLLDTLRRAHIRAGVEPPPWLDKIS